jgi:hypothetical protein
VISQGFAAFAVFVYSELFGRTTASSDAGAGGCEEGTSGAYDSENSGWVFRGGDAAVLGVQWEDGGENESEAEECKAGFLH